MKLRRVRAYGEESPNMLIRGDNLDALDRLGRAGFAGRFRCIYLDPPFNSGRVFREYHDAWDPEAWKAMMAPRLRALHPLLTEDGAIFAEIDDTQLGCLLLLMDDVFGPQNRIAIVTVVRSATTGHKAINRGPMNVTDYLLLYAKERRRFRPAPLVRRRQGRDPAYNLYLANAEQDPSAWQFLPLKTVVAKRLDYTSRAEAVRALGAEGFERAIERFSLENAARVVRFAQPRYEAVSLAARALIDRSRAAPDRVFWLDRGQRHKPMILRGGNRLLFLADKVREDEAGERYLAEPLTNVWNDIPFQGIAREGGVVFARNKKPERLLERVLASSTEPGDWVLDPFLGSGTTAAVAHKMGRNYVGIERSETLDQLCIPRLERVVDGTDTTGITRVQSWRGGGGFGIYD
ncbi:DNA methyltransferase [Pendulispora albinea]|uniref:Methyltransferase n=1 Tax=Pendulispora albinea TaxID=2741071 RepID=A0ABZ2LT98_9BACT